MYNYNDFCHNDDKNALNALRSVPGFDILVKWFMKNFSETAIHGLSMATKVRLSEKQMPEIYNLLPPICENLGIPVPDLFLESGGVNAYTMGDTKTSITIQSGLLRALTEDEIKCVLAHECGHILCHHVLYSTMAQWICGTFSVDVEIAIPGLGAIAMAPIKYALAYWSRCSEYSADRAAALCFKGSAELERVMMRLSGIGKSFDYTISQEEYLIQAKEYKDLIQNSGWNKFLQYLSLASQDHPFTAVRAYEINEWCKSDQFKYLISDEKQLQCLCPSCGNPVNSSWTFCKVCGVKIKN